MGRSIIWAICPARGAISSACSSTMPLRPREWQFVRFQVDPRAGARAYLARILWLQGLPDQAMRTAESSLEDARATNHAIVAGSTLSPWRHARSRCGSAIWPRRNITWKCCSTIRQGMRWGAGAPLAAVIRDCSSSSAAMSTPDYGCCAPPSPNQPRPGPPRGCLHSLFQRPRVMPGRSPTGSPAIEEAIVRSEPTEERWLIAELLRVKGELLLLRGAPGAAAAAEGHFRQALDWARRQGALSWELRAATSLARLWRDQAREQRGARAFGAGLRPVHRGLRDGRSESSKERCLRNWCAIVTGSCGRFPNECLYLSQPGYSLVT